MNILILNNGDKPCDYSELDIYGNIKYFSYSELQTISVEVLLETVDVLIITGGKQHVYENPPELQYELFLIEFAIQRKITIIGICLGFQIINHYFGNKVVRLPTPFIGHCMMEEDSLCFAGHELIDAFSFHYDGVLENICPDLEILAYSKLQTVRCIYYVKHRTLPIWAIQSHPDAHPDGIIRCGAEPLYTSERYTQIMLKFFEILA